MFVLQCTSECSCRWTHQPKDNFFMCMMCIIHLYVCSHSYNENCDLVWSWSEKQSTAVFTTALHPPVLSRAGGKERKTCPRWKWHMSWAQCAAFLGPFATSSLASSLPTAKSEGVRGRGRGSAPRMCLLSRYTNQTVVSVRCHCIVLGQVATDRGCHIDD